MDLDPYPGYFLKSTALPEGGAHLSLSRLDYLGRESGKRQGNASPTWVSFFGSRNGGWLNYLKFREDWERVMEEIQRDRMDGNIEELLGLDSETVQWKNHFEIQLEEIQRGRHLNWDPKLQ